jgi:ribosomal protein S18 acetylase RimI-like enzyme
MQMTPPLSFRNASDTDKEFLFRCYAATRAAEFEALGWPDVQLEAFLRMQYDARSRGYKSEFPDAQVLIVEYDGFPAGALTIDRTGPSTRLIDIAVLPEFQGKNIGTTVIRWLLDEGDPVELSVAANNLGAQSLYGRLGFDMVEAGEMYHRMRWEPKPDK